MRRKALFVVSHLPSPVAGQAGHKTAFHFLGELAETHDVDLIVLNKAPDVFSKEDMARHCRPITKSVVVIRVTLAEQVLGGLCGLFFGLAPRFCTRLSFRAMRTIKKLLVTADYDLIWAEFSQSFWITKLVDRQLRVLLSLHDIQTQLVASKSNIEKFFTLGFTFQSEKALLMRANCIRVQSVNDKWLLHTLFRLPLKGIEVREPSVSSFLAGVTRSVATVEPHSLLFWGAMGRRENSDAIIHFIEAHFRGLKQKYVDAKVYVVGSNPPGELCAMADSDIIVTGFVDDPTSYFERAGIGVAPLLSGAGIKVKVLEMLRAGLPVVSTPVGAEGIENPLLRVAEIGSFAQAIEDVWLGKN